MVDQGRDLWGGGLNTCEPERLKPGRPPRPIAWAVESSKAGREAPVALFWLTGVSWDGSPSTLFVGPA